jgi:hypothetical protein
MTKAEKIGAAFMCGFGAIGLFFLYKLVKKAFLKYQANKDRSYNVFDKAQLSTSERHALKRW